MQGIRLRWCSVGKYNGYKKIDFHTLTGLLVGGPVLLMGSLEDDMCRKDLLEEYREMSERIPESKIYFFEKGGHPAIGTNAENAAKIIIDYINE